MIFEQARVVEFSMLDEIVTVYALQTESASVFLYLIEIEIETLPAHVLDPCLDRENESDGYVSADGKASANVDRGVEYRLAHDLSLYLDCDHTAGGHDRETWIEAFLVHVCYLYPFPTDQQIGYDCGDLAASFAHHGHGRGRDHGHGSRVPQDGRHGHDPEISLRRLETDHDGGLDHIEMHAAYWNGCGFEYDPCLYAGLDRFLTPVGEQG